MTGSCGKEVSGPRFLWWCTSSVQIWSKSLSLYAHV